MRRRCEDIDHSYYLSPITYCLVIGCLLLLTSCAPLRFPAGASTIEAAARSWVLRDPHIQANTVAVRGVRMVGLGAVAIANYDAMQEGRAQKITALIFVAYSSARLELLSWHISIDGHGWRASEGVRFARDAGQPLPSLHAFFAADSTGQYNVIGGLVPDPAVDRVAVTLSNGLRRTASVVNGAYTIAQLSNYTVLKVEALDTHGNVMYEGIVSESGLRSN